MDLTLNLNKIIAMTTDEEFLSSYERIKNSYKSTLRQIEKAIELEEQDKPFEAIAAYEECLTSIEETFVIPVGLPDNTDNVQTEWNDACCLIQKLKGAKTEVTYRVKVLKQKYEPIDNEAVEANEITVDDEELSEPKAKKKSPLMENPPTYYDIAVGGCNNSSPKTYKQIAKGLRELMANVESPVIYDTLFHAQVKMYKIMSDGVVQTMEGESSMSLVMCTVGGEWSYLNGIYFIQCSMKMPRNNQPSPTTSTAAANETASSTASSPTDNFIWIYPLIPAVTSCYRTDYGAFIFPDLESDIPGSAFGLMLVAPPNITQEAYEDLQQFFLDLLEAVLAYTIHEIPQPTDQRAARDTSQQVSKHIVRTASFIARGFIKGAEKTGELMVKSTPYIISKLKPAPENAPPVSNAVKNTVVVAKGVTNAAVGVTGWVAGKVGSASAAIGKYLAPKIQHHGANLLQKTCGLDSQAANSKMEGALTVAAGAVEGFTTIVDGLEKSAAILGVNLSENSVKIIEHKYGSSAGNVAAETFDTLGNAFVVSRNMNYMLPKGIAKKMVKNTGMAVVDEYKQNYRNDGQYVVAGALYPDLRVLKNDADMARLLKE